LGAGVTMASYDEYHYNNNYYYETKVNVVRFFPTAIIGFRYQAKDNLFVKMAFTPFYFSDVNDNNYADNPIPGNETGIYNTLGFGLGYAF
jgi:hypothetical protein